MNDLPKHSTSTKEIDILNTILKHITKILLGLLVVTALLLVFAAPVYAASNWTAWYWNNTSLSGSPALQRSESNTPNYNWGSGSPAPGVIQPDYFSARWSSNQNLEAGRYRFTVKSDDGARLYVNGHLIIDEWHDATNIAYTAEYDVTTTSTPIVLEYYENIGDAQIHLEWEWIGNVASTGPTKAEYFNNMNLQGPPALVRNENEIYHWWGTGSPAPGVINNDHFSARYSRSMNLSAGRYRFTMAADDGMRMYVDGRLVFDRWYDSNLTPFVMEMDLTSGVHSFVVTYYENVGNAGIGVMGEKVGTSGSGGGSSGVTATVDTSYLNLRSGPGTQYDVIAVLPRGTVVELTGNQVDYWVEVITPTGQVGWVSNGYLEY